MIRIGIILFLIALDIAEISRSLKIMSGRTKE